LFNTATIPYHFDDGQLLEKRTHETASYLASTNANTIGAAEATQIVNETDGKKKKIE
jgi:hypothetical protein